MRLLVMEKMSDLPPDRRPRERLVRSGVGGLSDIELLALMIGSGGPHGGVEKIAAQLLPVLDAEGAEPDLKRLTEVVGVGRAKATLIIAALEFARRRLRPSRHKISQPSDVLPLVAHFADRKQEHFLALSLNGAHEVIEVRVVSVGLVNRTLVHPREVFADALSDRAAALIVAHNHPSGNTDPSAEDREVTRRLSAAGETLGLRLLDHIIFSEGGYYSFLEHGGVPK